MRYKCHNDDGDDIDDDDNDTDDDVDMCAMTAKHRESAARAVCGAGCG